MKGQKMAEFPKKPAMGGQKDVLSKVLETKRRGGFSDRRRGPKGLKPGRAPGGRPPRFPGRTGGR